MNKKEKYHRSCYRDFTNKVKKERAKDRYEDASRLSDAFFVPRKAGRPSLDKLPAQEKADESTDQFILSFPRGSTTLGFNSTATTDVR